MTMQLVAQTVAKELVKEPEELVEESDKFVVPSFHLLLQVTTRCPRASIERKTSFIYSRLCN